MDICIVFNDKICTKTVEILKAEIEEAVAKNPAKIKLVFSSNGGEIDEALKFYNWIKENSFPIEIHGFNKIQSSAIFVFLAFDFRFFSKGTQFVFHKAYIDETKRTETTSEEKLNEFNNIMSGIITSTLDIPQDIISIIGKYEVDIVFKNEKAIQNYKICKFADMVVDTPAVIIEGGAIKYL